MSLRAIGRRPTLGVELGALGAWIALAMTSGEVGAGGGSAGGPVWWCMPGMGGMSSSGGSGGAGLWSHLGAGLPMWGLMSVAMMLPPALPAVRHVAVNSLYWRRRRAVLEFLAAFLAIWVLFSLAALGALASLAPADSGIFLAGALALATLWQLTPLKRRALSACHRSHPLPPRGWRASAGAGHFGLRNGAACLASCWPLMLAMAFAGSARLVWMAALTGVVTVEKLALKPRRTTRRVAALLAAAAIGVAAATLGWP